LDIRQLAKKACNVFYYKEFSIDASSKLPGRLKNRLRKGDGNLLIKDDRCVRLKWLLLPVSTAVDQANGRLAETHFLF
jgi:hypothetical protein